MKRTYISPDIEIIEYVSATLLAASLEVVKGDTAYGEDYFSGEGDGEAAGAARGSWGSIWNEM